jgi:hypothetical protein
VERSELIDDIHRRRQPIRTDIAELIREDRADGRA